MKDPMYFPYRKSVHGEYFPVIDLLVYYGSTFARTSALIDSGASISVFRSEVADQLGLAIEKGKPTYLRGIAGRIEGYIHALRFTMGGKTFACPVVFSHEHLVSFNLLGREGFFEQFQITFDEKHKRLSLA